MWAANSAISISTLIFSRPFSWNEKYFFLFSYVFKMSNDFRTKPIGTGHHRPLFLALFIFQNIYRLCSLLLTTFHGQTFYYVFFQRPGTFQLHSQLHNYSLITKQSSNLINHFFSPSPCRCFLPLFSKPIIGIGKAKLFSPPFSYNFYLFAFTWSLQFFFWGGKILLFIYDYASWKKSKINE